MNFKWFLAYRYFRGRTTGSAFLSFIKIMAVAGVAIGSAGLLIALSIVHGFSSVIQEKILGYGTHISISTYADDPLYRSDTLAVYLQDIPGVDDSQAVIYSQGMVQTRDFAEGTFIKGVDRDGDLSNIRQYIRDGEYNLGPNEEGLPGAVIGARLARNLDASPGSVITAYAIRGMPTPLNLPQIQQFHVSGIYHTGIDQFDDVLMLVDVDYARGLFEMPPPRATQVDLRVADLDEIEKVSALLSDRLPFPYYTETIYERYRSIFAWINLQEQTIPFVIAVMIIVAAFNLIGTVLIMVLERTRDIGILKTMGANDKSVRSIFLIEGIIVGIAGLLIGIFLSLAFYVIQDTWQVIPLPEESYYMTAAPVQPRWFDFVLVSTITLILCALASWLPARVAARLNPLSVISYGR
ncbi:ABC transporter permease [Natronogracilivirga saccharolytica]|uniref:ABC transporter permease n=1 Tax=Natronogracilivirga saccharolytica TaxID=2812953 RepID=A0A8J7UVT9_9BACT|nr:ABC transporter permease [Natronogracilivirga saccharolytica]MBP3192916.1 ABC transporter permease [Natronogracilivirga saccharolytica]